MTNLMKLVKIIDLYEDRVSETRKSKLSGFPITGSIPTGTHLLEDLVKEYITKIKNKLSKIIRLNTKNYGFNIESINKEIKKFIKNYVRINKGLKYKFISKL